MAIWTVIGILQPTGGNHGGGLLGAYPTKDRRNAKGLSEKARAGSLSLCVKTILRNLFELERDFAELSAKERS